MRNILFSIIVPFFNMQDYLAECIVCLVLILLLYRTEVLTVIDTLLRKGEQIFHPKK